MNNPISTEGVLFRGVLEIEYEVMRGNYANGYYRTGEYRMHKEATKVYSTKSAAKGQATRMVSSLFPYVYDFTGELHGPRRIVNYRVAVQKVHGPWLDVWVDTDNPQRVD